MKNSKVRVMPVERQNVLKGYAAIAHGVQALSLLMLGFNKYLTGQFSGVWVFLAVISIAQLYVIAINTRIRRSRKLHVKMYGYTQKKPDSLFF